METVLKGKCQLHFSKLPVRARNLLGNGSCLTQVCSYFEISLKLLINPFARMFIPNAEKAVVDIRKLRDYCLNLEHDDRKHKARLFLSTLGITDDNAEELCQILLDVIQNHEAKLGRQDEFGQRYTLDFDIEWQNRSGTLRSAWIIEHGSEIPRLTTCYPL